MMDFSVIFFFILLNSLHVLHIKLIRFFFNHMRDYLIILLTIRLSKKLKYFINATFPKKHFINLKQEKSHTPIDVIPSLNAVRFSGSVHFTFWTIFNVKRLVKIM